MLEYSGSNPDATPRKLNNYRLKLVGSDGHCDLLSWSGEFTLPIVTDRFANAAVRLGSKKSPD